MPGGDDDVLSSGSSDTVAMSVRTGLNTGSPRSSSSVSSPSRV